MSQPESNPNASGLLKTLPFDDSIEEPHRLRMDFFKVGVELRADEEKFRDGVAAYLARQVAEEIRPKIRFRIRTIERPEPSFFDEIRSLGACEQAGVTETGALLETVKESDTVRWMITPKAAARIDLKRESVDGYIFESRETTVDNMRHVVCFFFVMMLVELLKSHKLFYLHASGVVSPSGRTVLLPGQGGDGKSTVALALLQSGWRYLSDDAVFLDMRDDTLKAHAFLKSFHIDPALGAHYPNLKALDDLPTYIAGNPKKEIDPRELFPGAEVQSVERVDALVFPRIVREETSSLKPISQGKAVAELIRLSSLQLINEKEVLAQVAALKRLADAPSARWLHGADLFARPAGYAERLGDYLESL